MKKVLTPWTIADILRRHSSGSTGDVRSSSPVPSAPHVHFGKAKEWSYENIGCKLHAFRFALDASTVQAQSGQLGQAQTNKVSDVVSRVTKVKGLRHVRPLPCKLPQMLCLDNFGIPVQPSADSNCIRFDALLKAGFTGVGQTIIIIDSSGSPTIADDLKTFDADYGLPDPPSLTVLAPLGTVPFDPTNSDQVGWAFETTLDVEWAHAMAPGAHIVLLTSPVSETEGVQGLPEFSRPRKICPEAQAGQDYLAKLGRDREHLIRFGRTKGD